MLGGKVKPAEEKWGVGGGRAWPNGLQPGPASPRAQDVLTRRHAGNVSVKEERTLEEEPVSLPE